MLSSLDIQGFKCFRHLRLPLGKLTLLTGFNGSGKSSAIQPLLLLAQGLRTSKTRSVFALNGPLVHLGTVGDVLPLDSSDSKIKITIGQTDKDVSWTLTAKAGDRFLRSEAEADATESLLELLARMTYISAVREGTADAYPLPDTDDERSRDVGIDGRFAPYQYDHFVDDEVPPQRRHKDEPATSLRKQLDAWLATLFPGAQANVQLAPHLSKVAMQFRLSPLGDWRRPANVGYGLTYAFPIVVALLVAKEGDIVAIDSPEAHLHPSAQSQMGRMLATFAAAGVQVLVETHSDHLLNGARLAVKEQILPPREICIHFFTGARKESHGVTSPLIDRDGQINEWPEGFFDQSEKDLSRLSGWT